MIRSLMREDSSSFKTANWWPWKTEATLEKTGAWLWSQVKTLRSAWYEMSYWPAFFRSSEKIIAGFGSLVINQRELDEKYFQRCYDWSWKKSQPLRHRCLPE